MHGAALMTGRAGAAGHQAAWCAALRRGRA
jgi:hypothetical protein